MLPASEALAQSWPIAPQEGEETPKSQRKDFNEDGAVDTEATWSSGGSGFWSSVRCVRDGRTGHRACSERRGTPYSSFRGVRIVSQPKAKNQAKALLEQPCPEAAPSAEEQASMWLLRSKEALAKRKRGSARLNWHKGKPVNPRGACLSLSQAKSMRGGWWSLQEFEGRPPKEWKVYYSAQWSRRGRELSVVAKGSGFEIFQHRHALAIYDQRKHRHAWFANYEGAKIVTESFKVDRWDIIQKIELIRGALKVRLRSMDDEQQITYQPARWLQQ